MKKVVRLTESDLVKIVKRVIKENNSNLSGIELFVLRYLDYMNSEKDLFSNLIEYDGDNRSVSVNPYLIDSIESQFGNIFKSRKELTDLVGKWVEKTRQQVVRKSFENDSSFRPYDDDDDM